MARERDRDRDRGERERGSRINYDDMTSRTADDIKRQTRGDFDSFIRNDVKLLRVKEGENCVRIMPRTWTDTKKWDIYWNIMLHVHYNVGPDNGGYLCLDKMKGERCPICDARREADEEESDALKLRLVPICWVIDRDAEKAGPQLWRMPKRQVFDEIVGRSVDKKSNVPIKIEHPDKGYDIAFSRTGKGVRSKYTGVEVLRDPSPLHDNPDIQDGWLAYIEDNPLPDVLQYYSAEHIEKVLYGAAGGELRTTRRREDSEEGGGRRERYRGASEDEGSGSRRYRGSSDDDGSSSRRYRGDDDRETARTSRREDDEPRGGRDEETRSSRREDDRPSRRGRDVDDAGDRETETRSRGRDRDDQDTRRGRNGSSSEEDDFREEETSIRRGRGSSDDADDNSPRDRARGQLENMRSRR